MHVSTRISNRWARLMADTGQIVPGLIVATWKKENTMPVYRRGCRYATRPNDRAWVDPDRSQLPAGAFASDRLDQREPHTGGSWRGGRRRVSSTAISVAISSSPTCPRSMRRDISSASIRPLLLGVDVVVPVEPAQGSLVVRLNLVRGGFPVNACPVNRTEAAKAEKHHICAPVTTRCAEYDMIGFGRAADSTPFNRCRAISGTEMARIHMPLEWIDERQPVRRS